MENLNLTGNQKYKHRKLKVFLDNITQSEFFKLTDLTDILICTNKADSDLEVVKTNHNQLTLNYHLENSDNKQISTTVENLPITLNLIHKLFEQAKDNIPSKTLNKKSLNKLMPENFMDLIRLSNPKLDLENNLQKLFEIEFINSYSTIHLFVHEKGHQAAKQYTIEKDKSFETEHSVGTFTTLFNAIKKSKNRSFGQSSLKASDFQIIGTCLAHELILTTHNVIFILTRNDFLPQNDTEIEKFNNIIGYVKFNLDNYFKTTSKRLNQSALETLKRTLEIDSYKNIGEGVLNFIKKNENNFSFHQEKLNLLGELLNTLRHELSNPLFGLQLSTELLKSEDLEEDQIELVNDISLAIKRSQSIMENFSNIYQTKSDFEEIDVKLLLKEVFTLTKSETRNIEREIIQITDEAFLVRGNKTWLAQIFFNLIINSSQAIKTESHKTGKIRIELKNVGNKKLITFIDNGPGIQKNSENIFNAFFTTKAEGTGLGLNICKNLMQKMNGEIVYVPNDKGAQFELILPNENTNN